jgi:peptide chain release factor subunit 1
LPAPNLIEEVAVFTETDLKDLISFQSPAPVLSVYLKTDLAEGTMEGYRLQLRNMLKKANLPEDVDVVERFFNHEHDWSGRGVAVFSSLPQQFFRSYTLRLPLFNWVYVADRPSVKPLADLIENHGGYGVAVMDRQSIRLFHIHLGEIQKQIDLSFETVKHTKRGGASSMTGRRGGTAGQTQYESELIDRNMREAVEAAVRFFEENHVRRILLGGHVSNLPAFQKYLPKLWQSLIMATFNIPIDANPNDILQKTVEIGKKSEIDHENYIVDELLSKGRQNAGAVLGLDATLSAVNERRVKILILDSAYHKSAFLCSECGLLSTTGDHCSGCSGAMQRLPDASDHAVSAVLRSGGEAVIVQANPKLVKAGSIGALLRY